MRKAGAFVASVAVASSIALQPPAASSSTSTDAGRRVHPPSCSHLEVPQLSPSKEAAGPGSSSRGGAPGKDKFAPQFDGLRFIETLVTAHR